MKKFLIFSILAIVFGGIMFVSLPNKTIAHAAVAVSETTTEAEVTNNLNLEKVQLDDLNKSEYHFFDRTDNFGYSGVGDAVNSLNKIAAVFPVFFFLTAMSFSPFDTSYSA